MGVVFKPPSAVVLACIFVFVGTTLAMVIYMQHARLVPNLEVSRTWEKFLQGLSGIELCATYYEDNSSPPDIINSLSTQPSPRTISRTVLANISLIRELTRLPRGTLLVTGQVPLGAWSRLCYNIEKENSLLNITFAIPDNLTQSEVKQVCVILSGTPDLLPLSTSSAICVPPLIDDKLTKVGILTGRADQTIFNTIRKSRDQCSNGSLIQITYGTEAGHVVFLSPAEKERITWHLEVFSGCLIMTCAVFIVLKVIISRRHFFVVDESYGAVGQMT